jgi:hypothetical protein
VFFLMERCFLTGVRYSGRNTFCPPTTPEMQRPCSDAFDSSLAGRSGIRKMATALAWSSIPICVYVSGMPCRLFGFGQRRTVSRQFSDVRVPSNRMKIGDTIICDVGDANTIQVLLDHH